jgi:RHS repeat-associated protein
MLIYETGSPGGGKVVPDRLGSVGYSTHSINYYPYGGEITTSNDGRGKFATYWRDSAGLDYAGQRYYANGIGRFLTPDPGGMGTANPTNPASWNRYAYVNGDPINHMDPKGLKWIWAIVGYDSVQEGYDSITELPMYNLVAVWDLVWEEGDEQPQSGGSSPLANRDLLGAAVKRAKKALSENEDCQKLFGNAKTRANGFDPSSILDQIAAGTFGTLKFDNKGAKWGVAGVSPNGVPKLSSVTITLNSYNDGTLAYWNLGNTDFNAETLLHELGHVYDLTKGSGNSLLKTPDDIPIIGSNRSAWNDWKVDQDCFHGSLGFQKP